MGVVDPECGMTGYRMGSVMALGCSIVHTLVWVIKNQAIYAIGARLIGL